ncbi:MAG: hypothetical protein JWN86_1597 [Planctomycetota bacterium]|nr:hypothetical protein [Planctomycetota bacterium]
MNQRRPLLPNKRGSTRPRSRFFLLALILASSPMAPSTAQDVPPKPNHFAAPTRRALIICGLPGDEEHRSKYAGAVEKIAKALVEQDGFASKDVWVRFGVAPKPEDGPNVKNSRGLSTKNDLAADVEAIRKASTGQDALWVIVLGHAHYDGRHAHLNLPGPDISDTAFGKLFEGIEAREQVFFITTSASGFFLKPLSRPGRVSISATEADQEVNETVYPVALAEVLAAPPTETARDKDGTFSVFDLYLAVVVDVMKRYADDELIATEHAQLDDNGDGHGSEVQLIFLPPESGGQIVEEKKPDEKKDKDKDKAAKKEKDSEAKKPPTLGPKDDGFLSSRVPVGLPPATPKSAETVGGPK